MPVDQKDSTRDVVVYDNLKFLELRNRIHDYPYEQIISSKVEELSQNFSTDSLSLSELNNLAMYLHELNEREQALSVLRECWDIVREEPNTYFFLFYRISHNLARLSRDGVPDDESLEPLNETPSGQRPSETPVFIGGSGRCGSTLLQRVLNDHSRITSFGETNLTDSKFFTGFCTHIARLDRDDRSHFIREFKLLLLTSWYHHPIEEVEDWHWGLSKWFTRNQIRRDFHLLDECREADTKEDVMRLVGSYIHRLFNSLVDDEEGHFWIEKNPHNVTELSVLSDLFPDMKFIHMVRDGRDAICSRVSRYRNLDPPLDISSQIIDICWGGWVVPGFSQLSNLDPDRLFNLRYEDFVSKPEKILNALCQFLDVPFESSLLNRTFYQDSIGRHKEELSRESRSYLQEVYGNLLRVLGYQCPPGKVSFQDLLSRYENHSIHETSWATRILQAVLQTKHSRENGRLLPDQSSLEQEEMINQLQRMESKPDQSPQMEAIETLHQELLT